jgi:hypothetical protein
MQGSSTIHKSSALCGEVSLLGTSQAGQGLIGRERTHLTRSRLRGALGAEDAPGEFIETIARIKVLMD